MGIVRSRPEMLEHKKAILEYINNNPDVSSTKIGKKFKDEVPTTLSWHLRVMSDQGLLAREKKLDVYHYTVQPDAFEQLEKEYSTPITRKSSKRSVKAKKNRAPSLNSVDVSTPSVTITIGGEKKEVSLSNAKILFFKLKGIFGDE